MTSSIIIHKLHAIIGIYFLKYSKKEEMQYIKKWHKESLKHSW